MKKISVIVPVYNTGKYLRKCFDSIVNQSYHDFTVIVVNDGSTDNSLEIIKEYDKKYPSLFKIYNIENSGRANARNYGLSRVKTEFFTFIDSDDYIDENTFLNFMQEVDKETDVVVCNAVRVINGNENNVLKFYNQKTIDAGKNLIISHPGPCGKLYRTKIFKDNNLAFPKDVKLYEDLGVIPLVGVYTNKIKYIDKPYYKYVLHHGSALRQEKFNENMHDIFKIMDILDEKFPKKYKDELEYLYIEHLLRTASLRYVEYKEGYEYIKKISDIMHKKYPKYSKNKYFKSVNYKFKIICFVAYNKFIPLLKILNVIHKKRQGI